MKYALYLLNIFVFISCQNNPLQTNTESTSGTFVEKSNIPVFSNIQKVYVPAYSNLYYLDGNNKLYYTVVLSLRNISFSDTIYFTSIEYYRDNGQLLRKYLNSPIMLAPMQSLEYIVDQEDKEGGAGANFVVSYGIQPNTKNQPLIETVMSGTAGQYGFAFKSEGIPIIE